MNRSPNASPVSKIKPVTYLGQRGEQFTVGKVPAMRVEVTHWLDDADAVNGSHPAGTWVLRLCTGDPRRPHTPFTVFHEETATDLTPDSARARAESLLMEKLT